MFAAVSFITNADSLTHSEWFQNFAYQALGFSNVSNAATTLAAGAIYFFMNLAGLMIVTMDDAMFPYEYKKIGLYVYSTAFVLMFFRVIFVILTAYMSHILSVI